MDAADRAQQEIDVELAERLERQARAAALDAPGAEICADCAEPIPAERRQAVPSAIRCINCQAYAERVLQLKERNPA